MINTYYSNGSRNEDEGVDLENILKKATGKTFPPSPLPLELGRRIKHKEVTMQLK